ncbi:MAG: signal peptidase I [Flavobacteriales bacterium]
MTYLQWFLCYLLVNAVHFIGSWKLYQKAGRKAWEAAIPVYNLVVLTQILDRPRWWVILFFIPVVNNVMVVIIWIDLLYAFNRRKFIDCILVIITLSGYLIYLNYFKDVTYSGRADANRETLVSALVFAIVAVTIIRAYTIEAFTIPTSSMEKTLMIGDFLFVNKMIYGARLPITPLTLPLIHRKVPLIHCSAFLNEPALPYLRFPAFRAIKNGDLVVFNYPGSGKPGDFPGAGDNVDKKPFWVKRCVGIAGDSLAVRNAAVFINGKPLPWPENARPQSSYIATTTNGVMNPKLLAERFDITDPPYRVLGDRHTFALQLNAENLKAVKRFANVTAIKEERYEKGFAEPGIFPADKNWNRDNYGPIYIPQAGDVLTLTRENIAQYRRLIRVYEHHKLEERDGAFFIDDKPTHTYRVQQNYYFMMGDNRHNSFDSRYWGYVPMEYIVGEPLFIWFSWNAHARGIAQIRWGRLMTLVDDKAGHRTSYLWVVALLILAYSGYSIYRKRKRQTLDK